MRTAPSTGVPAQPVRASGPLPAAERIEVVDTLRGFALFGILLINITAFKAPGGPAILGFDGGFLDQMVVWALILFVESKFFTLFSFLFGLGFGVQLLRASARGTPFVPRFMRRLVVLALFGALHVVLLWEGDILLLYALVGGLLLLFREVPTRTLLRWSLWLLLVPLGLYTLGFGALEVARTLPGSAAALREADAAFLTAVAQERVEGAQLYANGSYVEVLVARVESYGATSFLLLSRVPSVLAMFLLGLYVVKRGVLEGLEAHLPLVRRARRWGLGLGLLTSLFVTLAWATLPPVSSLVVLFFNQALAGPLLAVGYAAALALLARRPVWAARLAPLAATGRMALTNYLTQSLVCTLLFYGYGFGLAGKVGPSVSVPLAVGIYALQVAFSRWWLRRFRFGPLEWLWRSLTYGRVQPLRLPA